MKAIGKSNVNLTTLFEYVKQFTSGNVIKTGNNPAQILLTYETNLAKHLSYSFLTVCSRSDILSMLQSFEYLKMATIEESGDDMMLVVTGTLEDWKNAIAYSFTASRISFRVEKMMEEAYTYFKNEEGLGFLWRDYNISKDHTGKIKFLEKK